MKRQDISTRVQQALDSLEGVRPAAPPPYLYTRIRARMDRRVRPLWERVSEALSRPWVATSLAAALVVVHAYLFFNAASREDDPIQEEQTMASNSDYTLHTTSFYESHPDHP